MHSSVLRRRPPFLAVAAAAALVFMAAAGTVAAVATAGPVYEKKGSVHVVEEAGYLYTFDAVWRVETLRRIDPATKVAVRISEPEPAYLSRFRAMLLRELRVPGLSAIPVEGKAEVEAIRALGYI